MNRNSLKTPTGRRQTSWLFSKRAGVEFGATEDKSIQWQGGGLEPGTSGLEVQRPNARLLRCGINYRMKRTNLQTTDISVQLNRQIVVGFPLMKINMAQRKFDMNL